MDTAGVKLEEEHGGSFLVTIPLWMEAESRPNWYWNANGWQDGPAERIMHYVCDRIGDDAAFCETHVNYITQTRTYRVSRRARLD